MEKGHLLRPFSEFCEVRCRGYSLPLQRRIADFGADVPFGKVPEKIMEHYGITVPCSSAQSITEKHAERVKTGETRNTAVPEKEGEEYIIAETDGSMIPIVDTEGEKPDRRKNRSCRWKEARLTLTHPGSPDEAGDRMLSCAIRSGMGQNTEVHCVGDGAPWIAEQTDRVFGEQGRFLIDFYHLCGYLSDASAACCPSDPDAFFTEQKHFVKEGRITEAVSRMQFYAEPASVPDSTAPVRRCIRYIT